MFLHPDTDALTKIRFEEMCLGFANFKEIKSNIVDVFDLKALLSLLFRYLLTILAIYKE